MITYRCEKDNIEVNTSVCPHCGERAFPYKSEIYWCKHCQIPTYDKTCAICKGEGQKFATDARPVFPEEKILLECIMRQQKEQGIEIKVSTCLKDVSVWNGTGNNYYGNGTKLGIKIGALRDLDMERIKKEYKQAVLEKLDEYQLFFEKNMFLIHLNSKLQFNLIDIKLIY